MCIMERRQFLTSSAVGLSILAGCTADPQPDKVIRADDLGGSWETQDEPTISEDNEIESAQFINESEYRRTVDITIYPCNGSAANEECTIDSYRSNIDEEDRLDPDVGRDSVADYRSYGFQIQFAHINDIVRVHLDPIVTNEMIQSDEEVEEQLPDRDSRYEEAINIAETQSEKLDEVTGESV